MRRRVFLRLGGSAVAVLFLTGHTPYRQWAVFRKRHLLVGTSRTDVPTYALGREIAAILSSYLPESKARVSRAPDQWRLASLISSQQLDLVLLSATDAIALAEGTGAFEEFGGVSLNGLFRFGEYYLICRPDFPDRHAYLLAQTLSEHAGTLAKAEAFPAKTSTIPIHPGALAYAEGRTLPARDEAAEVGAGEHGHVH